MNLELPSSSERVPFVVVGIGRWSMGDDAVGLHVAEALELRLADLSGKVRIIARESPGTILSELEEYRPRSLIVVDAAVAGDDENRPCVQLSWPLPRTVNLRKRDTLSTHYLGIATLMELTETLFNAPHETAIFAVFGEDFRSGFGLSNRAQGNAKFATDAVELEIRRKNSGESACTN